MTPSDAIMRQAHAPIHVSDGAGRQLVLHKLTALDTLRLLKAAGPVLAQNEAWLAMAGLVFSVTEIDGVPVPAPITEAQIEALVERLGDAGLDAVAQALGSSESDTSSRDAVGNSQGTPS